METLANQPRASIPTANEGWTETKAAYRLLSNEAVDAMEILNCHAQKTEQRAKQHKTVLCLQDTTELDFTSQPGIRGLGRLSYEAQHGMYAHLTLMVTPERMALGILDAWTWARKPKDTPAIRESIRWKEGYTIVADTAQKLPDTRFVYIADREADIYELLDEARTRNYAADFLIRARHNRKLAQDTEKLWDKVERQTALGQLTFTLEANGERKARKVCLNLYALRVSLPQKSGKPELNVTAILAKEHAPPQGEAAIDWRFLTNCEVTSLEQASTLLDWYRCRWLIEIFFRILKSGCQVEARQLASIERLERLLMIYYIIAWRILHLVTLGQACPNLPCDIVFDTEEWQAAILVKYRQKPPPEIPSLADMVRLIAYFGGFLGRKSDGFPGPKAIWQGLEKVRHFAVGIEVSKAVYAST